MIDVEKHKGLCYKVILDMKLKPDDDILGAAMYGLCLAANGFDEEKGIAFTTYAYKAIRRAIARDYKNDRLIKGDEAVVQFTSIENIYELQSNDEEHCDLLDFIHTLSENEQYLFKKKYLEGLTNSEIAIIRNVSAQRIGKKLSELRDKIRYYLNVRSDDYSRY